MLSNVPATHDLSVGHVAACQICASLRLELVLDLGHHPPCDSLLSKSQLQERETTYPLRFLRCRECGLAQIDYVVAPQELFYPAYPYRSGITESLRKNLMGIAEVFIGELHPPAGSLAVDLGSNDGTTLEGFKAAGMRVLGVEPTDIARIAVAHGIPTLQKFFTEQVAREIVAAHGRASIVTANNMFAHVANLAGLINGVAALLDDEGVFLSESHYLIDLLETTQYDSIYHEHLRYYSLHTLVRLLASYDFTVIDAERIPNYGGSIRVYAQKGRGRTPRPRLQELLASERRFLNDESRVYGEFVARTERSKRDLLSLLLEIRGRGERVVGIGCPGRCSTLLNYCGIGPDLMPYIAEQASSLKVGMHLPGRHIPVVDEQVMFDEQPEYAVMLSWHYHQPIVAKLRQRGLRAKIILPLPDVRILDN
jgi:hypothetical protein